MKGIFKHKDGWRLVVRVRVNGKIVQRRKIVRGTKEQAKALREHLKKQIRAGKSASCSLISAPKLFKHILNIYRVKSDKAPFSEEHEKKIARLEYLLGESEAVQFPDRFERHIAEMRVKGKNHQANRFTEIARAAFQVCVGLEYFKENPITEKRFPLSKETARDNYIPAEEVKGIILEAAKNRRTCHIARALQYYFSVPCRKGEVVRMRITDIDLFRQRVRVHNGTTKNDAGIWKPIPPAMLKWFKRRVREAKSLEEPVFCRIVKGSRQNRKDNEPRIVPLGDFKRAWGTVRKNAGHTDLHVHDSRHVSATDMVNNGTPRTVVNTVAGWRTDMLKTYYHLDSDAALSMVQWPKNEKREPFVNHQTAEAM